MSDFTSEIRRFYPNMGQFLFAFVSISLKSAFKNTSAKKVDLG